MWSKSISRLHHFENIIWKNLKNSSAADRLFQHFKFSRFENQKCRLKISKSFWWNLEIWKILSSEMIRCYLERFPDWVISEMRTGKIGKILLRRKNRIDLSFFSRFELLRSKNITILKNLSSIRLFKITSSYQIRCYIFHLEKSKVRNVFIDEEYESWQRFENLKVISVCFEFL